MNRVSSKCIKRPVSIFIIKFTIFIALFEKIVTIIDCLELYNKTTFGLSECSKEIRVQVENYFEDNKKQFINFIVGNFNQYAKKIRDSAFWRRRNQELVIFY